MKPLSRFFTRHRQWLGAVTIVLILYQLRFGIVPGWKMQSDFPNYFTASKLLIDGAETDSIYNNAWFQKKIHEAGFTQEGKFTPFPPVTALVFVPIAWMEPLTAKRCWMIVNLILAAGLVRMGSKLTQLKNNLVFIILLLSGIGLANNLYLGQLYVFVLFLCVWALLLEKNRRDFFSGFLLGLASAVKYFPVLFLIPSIIRKKTSAILGFLAGFGLLNVVAFLLMKQDVFVDYSDILKAHLSGNIEGQSPYAWPFQSWNAWLLNLFVYDPVDNPHPLFHLPVLFSVLRFLIPFTLAALATYVLLRRKKTITSDSLILVPVAALASLPASATYHYLFLIIPMLFLVREFRDDKKRTALILLAFGSIGFVPPLLEFAYRHLDVPELLKFHRLWLVTLFYFVVLYLMERRNSTGLLQD